MRSPIRSTVPSAAESTSASSSVSSPVVGWTLMTPTGRPTTRDTVASSAGLTRVGVGGSPSATPVVGVASVELPEVEAVAAVPEVEVDASLVVGACAGACPQPASSAQARACASRGARRSSVRARSSGTPASSQRRAALAIGDRRPRDPASLPCRGRWALAYLA